MQAVRSQTGEMNEMVNLKKIRSALVSVYHKEGLENIIPGFIAQGVSIYSTGGTADYIRKMGAKVNEVASLTDYPSILGGRVKTLHPKVFGGILARREEAGDLAELDEYGIPSIDAVIVDLYPFEETVASGASEPEIIEKIDIGGIALIRAGAKNFRDVVIVPSSDHYGEFGRIFAEQEGSFSLEQRKWFAAQAFDVSSHYDTQIFGYMHGHAGSFKLSLQQSTQLRYGENPHQKAWYFGKLEEQFEVLGGKPLSYNNLVDIDATLALVDEFDETVFAIIKHTNPCGVATGRTVKEAWRRALECDPLSAFGGILACNGEIDAETAAEISERFYEVLVADSFSEEALGILTSKKKRIILRRKNKKAPSHTFKAVLNGVLVQELDREAVTPASWEVKSSRQPKESEIRDIIFGDKVVKHLKSNAIAVIRDGQLIGSGIGQTSRVDALKQALQKAQERGFDLNGAVLSSDAFFPFADSAEIAADHGIEVIAEPGGSVKDQDTIDFCESRNMCLIFTYIRHFKH